jgi:hypothetical protein
MIAFKDFAPRLLQEGGMFSASTFETLGEAVDGASHWCAEHGILPLNVETLLLPDIHDSSEEGSEDVHLTTGDRGTEWHQIVRVWYLTK